MTTTKLTLADLMPLPIWVRWRQEDQGGSPTKVPYSVRGGRASTNNPATWTTFERALGDSEPGPEGGVGVVFGELPGGLLLAGIDYDSCVALGPGAEAGDIEIWANECVERLRTYTEISPSGTGVKSLFLVRPDAAEAFRRSAGTTVWRRPGGGKHGPAIELYTRGRYFAVTGRRVGDVEEIREFSLSDLEWVARDAAPRFMGRHPHNGAAPEGEVHLTMEDLAAAYRILPNVEDGWETWSLRGMCAFAVSGGSEEGFEIFKEFSARAHCYDEAATRERWTHWRSSPPRLLGATTVLRWVREVEPGWKPPSWRTTAESPAFSDDWLALRFVDSHVVDARYTTAWGRWSCWVGSHWETDERGRIESWVRIHCREAARETTKRRTALTSAATLSATMRMARVDQRIAAGPETWDRDPWLLATPGGTVDLKTGRLRDAEPNDYCSMVAATAPGGVAERWMEFLAQVVEPDVAQFLKRICGYCLTGLTREEVLFFMHGTGGNGKGTFIETVRAAMGGYATTMAMTTLVQTLATEHPTEIAKLRGARLAVAQETEDGSRWNAKRIKDLTGGDVLTARFMREDYFDFSPTHKLVISGNRKPMLGRVDNAIRRRMVFLPFERAFAKPDRQLKEALRAEAPGVLGWAVEGCMEWQRVGLAPPESIRRATEEYLHDQDDVQVWIDECCVMESRRVSTTSELFISWSEWCQRSGGFVGSRKVFAEALKVKFQTERGHGNALLVHGVGVARVGEQDAGDEGWTADF